MKIESEINFKQDDELNLNPRMKEETRVPFFLKKINAQRSMS